MLDIPLYLKPSLIHQNILTNAKMLVSIIGQPFSSMVSESIIMTVIVVYFFDISEERHFQEKERRKK